MSDKPKTPRAQCDIWLMIDGDGEYVASHDEETLSELYSEHVGGVPANCRTIHLSLSTPLPCGVEAFAKLPDEADAEDGVELAVTAS
jgi:hypothetical protein